MLYRKKWVGYLMVVPAIVFLAAFIFYPLVQNLINSFMQFNPFLMFADQNPVYVGFANYTKFLIDPLVWLSFWNTIVLVFMTIVFQVGLALIFAILVDSIKKGATIYKVVYFLPIVIAGTAIALMFNMFYIREGAVNQLLVKLGTMQTTDMRHLFDLAQPYGLFGAYILLMVPVIWQYVGFYFVILLTGIANIPEDLNEAAKIDGVTRFQRVTYITLPMLWNVLRTCMVLAITGALKVFDMPYAMLGRYGGLNNKGWVLGTYLYYVTWDNSDVGKGAVFALFLILVGIGVSYVSNSLLKENKDI